MCHRYADPDAYIAAETDRVVNSVMKEVMVRHVLPLNAKPDRFHRDGVVFIMDVTDDIHSNSEAGKRITKELMSLGFIHARFYDNKKEHYRTILEYTLAPLALFEEERASYEREMATSV
ncbi:hypothetical protein MZD04_gp336 [Pseudomonas phage Psa21]|uniref:Uncharacterized protein n=1 Tax=Pseudomonas phage Psa21 TaxID=2530023 RepID=A0A481W583_9CAUD|nr:hypothetical protein MZD04_gp336 [Pseudomonas phage Psa21]QBJ02862.1 hypothetical protein PSA21_336 [Pseudomonas phage Psa21]